VRCTDHHPGILENGCWVLRRLIQDFIKPLIIITLMSEGDLSDSCSMREVGGLCLVSSGPVKYTRVYTKFSGLSR
jgi:hypothetical protein